MTPKIQKAQDIPIYLWWNAQNGTKVFPKTSHRVFSWSLSSQRSRTANTHAPICFLGKLPGARTRLWASKSSENEKPFNIFPDQSFSLFHFQVKVEAFFVGGQDSISVIASQFYISSNKQKLLANIDQRDSKVLLLIVTSSMKRGIPRIQCR